MTACSGAAGTRDREKGIVVPVRLAGIGVVLALVLFVTGCSVGSFGQSDSAETDGEVVLTYRGPGQHSEEYTSFNVTFTNNSAAAVENPQARVLVNVADKEWPCQGYINPETGAVVFEVNDASANPLVIPAGQSVEVAILCRVPDAPLDDAKPVMRT
jgi:hypothetical protein